MKKRSSNKIRRTQSLDEEEDCFEKLPDILIIEIFTRLNDVKSLTMFLLMNKRLASLVILTSPVSLLIHEPRSALEPAADGDPTEIVPCYEIARVYAKDVAASWYDDEPWCVWDILPWKINRYVGPNEAMQFFAYRAGKALSCFREVESVNIDFPRFEDLTGIGDIPMKWKVEFSAGPGLIRSCCILGATHMMSSSSSCTDPQRGEIGIERNEWEITRRVRWSVCCLNAAYMLYSMVEVVALDHEKVRDISVTSPSRKSRLHAGEDVIRAIRSDPNAEIDNWDSYMRIKMWYMPVLKLPESNQVLLGATFVLVLGADQKEWSEDEELNGFWNGCGGGSTLMALVTHEAEREMRKKMEGIPYTLEMDTYWEWPNWTDVITERNYYYYFR